MAAGKYPVHLRPANFLRLGAGLVQQIFDVCGPHFAFQNILPGSQAQGLLGIGELGIVGENDKFRKRQLFLCLAHQLQAIHHRHTNISEHNIRLDLLHHLQSLRPVGGRRNFVLRGNGTDAVGEPLPNGRLIVHHGDFQIHRASSFASR